MFESISFETAVRLVPFLAIIMIMVLWELLAPKREDVKRSQRWPGNLGIFVFNAVMLFLLPVTAISAALVSIEYKVGLFFWLEFPFWPKIIVTLVLLDLSIYWQHRLFHLIPLLWRVHRMHHSDTNFDVTTALRFHPLEIFLSMFIKAGTIILLGAPVFAVILFEIILNGCAMFNHSNVRMPKWLDIVVRLFVVTPDMHRVHHSIDPSEHNNNYGFALSIWDRLFGTYKDQPEHSHESMPIGLPVFSSMAETRFDKMITQPFRNPD
jgi:sterol desaturase/sphingolipid hydroxylase (fatty acid hydroxylase superfamily)